MGSSSRFREIFARDPQARHGVTFARFMELALYDPEVGYYARPRPRIGRATGRDFYTASSLGPLFGELVAAAAESLLGGHDPQQFTFIEIGAEPRDGDGVAAGILRDVPHPFAAARTIPLGQAIDLSGRCVVFSNELFDAQPCHRLVRRNGAWRETGVALVDDALVAIELPAISEPVRQVGLVLPEDAAEGYRLDLPLKSVDLLRQLTVGDWQGLFLAFDYGKFWPELSEATPQGTARGYADHQQTNDLLAAPGEQDLTCHVCWNWLAESLAAAGFDAPIVERQESFFVHRAPTVLEATVRSEAAGFSARKQALAELLHPARMGHKFQVLHALRISGG